MADDMQVQYDMQFSTNGRINYWLWFLGMANQEMNVHNWLKACDNLFLEISSRLSDTEFKEHLEFKAKAKQKAAEYFSFLDNQQKNKSKFILSPPDDVFDVLFEWSVLTRRKLDKIGLLWRNAEDSYSAMI